jgi:predicted DNA-binding protein (UPF0251 family)
VSPRYKKNRSCGCKWRGRSFKPTGISMKETERISLYKDELEALKLCDLDGLTQEEAGRSMGISRGTVQRILAGARKKTALALSQGKALVFEEPIYMRGELK